ncbi:MAG: NAD(P)-dependent oxidoreductase [Spirochaetia bacterium]|jgi:dTDP-4-dehydrorhamnose reductase|nr:NAD(P)-dependent oxidoreductase [Spirochaetia bacterium]
MKRVLLTGGNGFIGTRFREAHHHNFEILSTDVDQLNILNKDKVEDALNLFKPDYVIHAAAIALTDFCNENPDKCREINVIGAVNIAEACKKTGSKMIFLSTEQVFNGNRESGPYSESDTPLPDTMYGKNKLEAENLIKDILDDYLILRFTWMFGIPERFRPLATNILWSTIETVMKGEQIKVPVYEFRGLTYINELMDQFDKIMDLPTGTYHVGSNNEKNRYDIVCHILNEMGLEYRIDELIIKDEEKYKDNPRDARLETSRAQSHGIEFSESMDAISRCIREYHLEIK